MNESLKRCFFFFLIFCLFSPCFLWADLWEELDIRKGEVDTAIEQLPHFYVLNTLEESGEIEISSCRREEDPKEGIEALSKIHFEVMCTPVKRLSEGELRNILFELEEEEFMDKILSYAVYAGFFLAAIAFLIVAFVTLGFIAMGTGFVFTKLVGDSLGIITLLDGLTVGGSVVYCGPLSSFNTNEQLKNEILNGVVSNKEALELFTEFLNKNNINFDKVNKNHVEFDETILIP